MATIPDVTALPQASPQPAGGTAAYEPPNWRQVGMAGQEIQGAGRDLQQAGDTIAQTNDRQDAIVAQSAANSLRSTAIALQYDPMQGFASVKEGGAVGQQFIDNYTQRFNDQQRAIRGALTSPNQQRMFDQHAQINQLQFKQALLEHQAQQTAAFNDTTDNDTVQLALRTAAARPLDDLGFQTSLAQINGTIDSMGQRKGLPPQAVSMLKAQYFDAAYNTRIMAVMNGVPGVVTANPYLAEKMFEQVQPNLGPTSQVQLGHDVQKSVQLVQQRDLANNILAGRQPVTPAMLAPAVAGSSPYEGIVRGLETDGDPNAVSPKGATGLMQVMPGTATNPGYGVTPAALGADGKPLPGEVERVGQDYLGAMTARYQNPALVLAAYNAGPGRVDQWLAKLGDPRTGAISTADWAAKIPFDETQKYVTSGLAKLGDQAGGPAAGPAPTANDLKTRTPALMQQARDAWLQLYPNDVVGADGAATRVASYAQLAVAQQTAQQDAARDTLTRGLVGSSPDGSQKPLTMDALLADPQMKAAWSAATPEVQMAIQDRMKAGGDPPRTPATQTLVYQLMGQYSNDRQGFANLDLTPLVSKLPFADFDKLTGMQVAARNKADLDAERSSNMLHALALAKDYALLPAHIAVPDKNTSPTSDIAHNFNAFTGALGQELDDFQAKNKRRANDSEIIAMSKNLTTQVQVPGRLWGTNSIPAFNVTPDIVGSVTATVPPDFRAGITAAIKARGGVPTEAQIQTAYLTSLRSAPKKR